MTKTDHILDLFEAFCNSAPRRFWQHASLSNSRLHRAADSRIQMLAREQEFSEDPARVYACLATSDLRLVTPGAPELSGPVVFECATEQRPRSSRLQQPTEEAGPISKRGGQKKRHKRWKSVVFRLATV